MILKIKRERDNQDWWILDDIRKISIGKPQQLPGCDLGKELGVIIDDIFIMDNAYNIREDGGDQSHFEYIRLIIRLNSNEEKSIVFDTVAYLCNDLGKTIEKIVVNY